MTLLGTPQIWEFPPIVQMLFFPSTLDDDDLDE